MSSVISHFLGIPKVVDALDVFHYNENMSHTTEGQNMSSPAKSHRPKKSRPLDRVRAALEFDDADWKRFLGLAVAGFAHFEDRYDPSSSECGERLTLRNVPEEWFTDAVAFSFVAINVFRRGRPNLHGPVAHYFFELIADLDDDEMVPDLFAERLGAERVKNLISRALRQTNSEVRLCAYRVGLPQFGVKYAERALDDRSPPVRKWAQKALSASSTKQYRSRTARKGAKTNQPQL